MNPSFAVQTFLNTNRGVTMRFTRGLFLFGVVVLVIGEGSTRQARADMIVSNYAALPSTDGNSITTDTSTGLDWLDPSATSNLSFNQVSSLLGNDPRYSGFRYATGAELMTFFDHLGLPTSNFPAISSVADGGTSYAAAAAYFGTTPTPANPYATRGLLAIPFGTDQHYYGSALIGVTTPAITLTAANSALFDGGQNGGIGSWLVRDTRHPTIVAIDIKPGSFPNSINLNSNGVVAVAILSSPSFNVVDVDVNTVLFAGASPKKFAYENVNDDGVADLILHFRTQDLQLPASSTEATLTAQLRNGGSMTGTDSVRIVPKKEKAEKGRGESEEKDKGDRE